MTGCTYLRGDIYYIRIKYYDSSGKLKEKWVSTGLSGKGAKHKAELMIDDVLSAHAYLETGATRSMDFADYLKRWQLSRVGKVERSTYEGYITYFDRHLIPYFKEKNMKIQDIKPIDIMNFIEYKSKAGRCDKKKGGLSADSIKKLVSLLRQVFDQAVVLGDIPYNPALRLPMPKEKKTGEEKAVYLSVEEAQEMLAAFAGDKLEPLVYVTLYYGLRRSEVLGLKR